MKTRTANKFHRLALKVSESAADIEWADTDTPRQQIARAVRRIRRLANKLEVLLITSSAEK